MIVIADTGQLPRADRRPGRIATALHPRHRA